MLTMTACGPDGDVQAYPQDAPAAEASVRPSQEGQGQAGEVPRPTPVPEATDPGVVPEMTETAPQTTPVTESTAAPQTSQPKATPTTSSSPKTSPTPESTIIPEIAAMNETAGAAAEKLTSRIMEWCESARGVEECTTEIGEGTTLVTATTYADDPANEAASIYDSRYTLRAEVTEAYYTSYDPADIQSVSVTADWADKATGVSVNQLPLYDFALTRNNRGWQVYASMNTGQKHDELQPTYSGDLTQPDLSPVDGQIPVTSDAQLQKLIAQAESVADDAENRSATDQPYYTRPY